MEFPMGITEKGIRENMMVVVVVEYLGDSMSKDLLGKFPDYSAFDFDYSQSSIWSPLRKLASPQNDENDNENDMEDEEEEGEKGENEGNLLLVDALKKATGGLKRKVATGTHAFRDKIRMLKLRKKKKAAFDFSPAPVSSPTPRKVISFLLPVQIILVFFSPSYFYQISFTISKYWCR